MWLIGDILVGHLGSVRSYEDGRRVENSVLYCGRECGGWRFPGFCSVHNTGIQQSKLQTFPAEIDGAEVLPFSDAEILKPVLNIMLVYDGSSRTLTIFLLMPRPKAITPSNGAGFLNS